MDNFYDLIISGGQIVTGNGIKLADLGVRDGKIAAIEPVLDSKKSTQVIRAAGKYVLPGIIDVHVHPVYLDDVEGSSRVAAYGGVTTLMHFAYSKKGESLLEKVSEMLEDAVQRSVLDFSIHGGLFDSPNQVPEIPSVMKLGVRSFKFFLTYLKLGWYTDDYQLIKAMDLLASNDGMAMVHAENGGGIDYLEDKYLKGPQGKASNFNISRPAALEEEAIFRAICMAEITKCPLYIPHVTAARSLRPIRNAKSDGLSIFAETCPQYLNLTQEILETKGALAKIGPPIRTSEDQKALWEALRDGTIQTVASDHAPKHKDLNGDFLAQGFGSPQIETLLTMTYHGGVNSGRISLVRLVQVLCENPARIFGIYPQKGTLAVGSDADMVIFDPNQIMIISEENQHSKANYSLYEGCTVLGWPESSFQRGKPVLKDGNIVASTGSGNFLEVSPAKHQLMEP